MAIEIEIASKPNSLIRMLKETINSIGEETNRISTDIMKGMITEGKTTKIKKEGESF